MTENRPRQYIEFLLVGLILAASYVLFKLPISHIPILFYDDGEMTYHALAMGRGLVPYLDTHSHHFLGYALPIIALGKILGYSAELLSDVGIVFQITTASLIYILIRRYISAGWSLFASILYISAREPWVNGFPLQYQMNLLIVLMLLAIARWKTNQATVATAVIAGIGFVFDQRALALLGIPTLLVWLNKNVKLSLQLLIIPFLIFPTLAALFLIYNGAWESFIYQTFIFPATHRVGSLSIWDSLAQAFNLHRYLLTTTPWLLALAFCGFASLWDEQIKKIIPKNLRSTLIFLPAILFAMAGIGGRDYDYYTIIWLPLLAVLAGIFFIYVKRASLVTQLACTFLVIIGMILPYAHSIALIKLGEFAPYSSDGSVEVGQFLQQEMRPSDTMFVWGYRLDLYLRAQKTSPFPDATLLLIHPDGAIAGAKRWRHVSPKYEYEFFERFSKSPPTFLVLFSREEKIHESPAQKFVFDMAQKRYEMVFEIKKKDYLGGYPHFKVYQLK